MMRQIAVVVPAADEESSIERCLVALHAAVDVLTAGGMGGAPVPVRIVVVLDGCTDGTAAALERWPGVETVSTSARNVGQARRLGAAHALRGADPREVWLASTDADSQVPIGWLAGMLRLSETSDLVLGTVVPDTGLPAAIEGRWTAEHVLQDGHPHVHAANLGIRADAYLALGGWAPLAVHEDVDLVARAGRAGLRISRTASIPVCTSTRTVGRAPSGFSSYLRALGHV